jgi:hypothetical protein
VCSACAVFDRHLQRQAGTHGGGVWISRGREGKTAGGDAHPRRRAAGSVSEVKLLVARGYAALSVNWGGSGTVRTGPFKHLREVAKPGDPNTDWGAVDPTQLNVQGYSSMLAGSEAVLRRPRASEEQQLVSPHARLPSRAHVSRTAAGGRSAAPRRAWLLDGRQSHDVCRGHR